MNQIICPKMINYQSETQTKFRRSNTGQQSEATSKQWKEEQASFLKLFESQATHKVFESQYSNSRKLLRVFFVKW